MLILVWFGTYSLELSNLCSSIGILFWPFSKSFWRILLGTGSPGSIGLFVVSCEVSSICCISLFIGSSIQVLCFFGRGCVLVYSSFIGWNGSSTVISLGILWCLFWSRLLAAVGCSFIRFLSFPWDPSTCFFVFKVWVVGSIFWESRFTQWQFWVFILLFSC